VIETPGKEGKFETRVVGVIRFLYSERYCSLADWHHDVDKHLCREGTEYEWDGVSKIYGWKIIKAVRIKEPFLATGIKRGIVYSSPYEAEIEYGSLSKEEMLKKELHELLAKYGGTIIANGDGGCPAYLYLEINGNETEGVSLGSYIDGDGGE